MLTTLFIVAVNLFDILFSLKKFSSTTCQYCVTEAAGIKILTLNVNYGNESFNIHFGCKVVS